MKRYFALLGILVMLAGTGLAQADSNSNVDTVVLASTSNYPDAMISSSVSEKLGYPVILTEEAQLSSSAENTLESMNPETVVMVGGPSVLSEQVESSASEHGNVTRLWGTTQVGTSVEVAEYFWPEGSEEAVIVQYPLDDSSYHSLMGAVKNNADERPVLVSKEGTLSASVLSSVNDMGVEEAEVYSTNAVNVTEDLESSGVTDVEVHSGERDELEDDLREQTTVQNRDELVIVAAGNFRDTISVPNNPNSASYIVSNEDQIQGAITLVEESDEETRIKVVGNPQLAQNIASQIEDETERDVDQISGSPEEISSGQAREQRNQWQQIQEQRSSNWRQNIEQGMMEHANRSLQRAERAVDENSSQEARNHLQNAREAFEDEDYFEARRLAGAASSAARVTAFGNLDDSEIREEIREDREDFREAAEELSENNQEMAEELSEAESEEERREIIREYREERRDIFGEVRDQDTDDEEREDRQERDAPNETSTRLEMQLDGNELEVDSWFVGRTGGFTVDKALEVEQGQITGSFNFIPPNGPATQALTEYESDMETTLEDGDYSIEIELREDGDVRETISDSISVPGEVEIERRTNGIEAGGNSVELKDEDLEEDN